MTYEITPVRKALAHPVSGLFHDKLFKHGQPPASIVDAWLSVERYMNRATYAAQGLVCIERFYVPEGQHVEACSMEHASMFAVYFRGEDGLAQWVADFASHDDAVKFKEMKER